MSTSLSERGVAFVGLGTMGRGMALNVAKQVQPLLLFDIDATAVSTVLSDAQDTAAVLDQAKSLAELSRQSSLIVLCLPDGETVEEVVSKEMLPFLKPDSLVVDASTTSPETSRRLAQELSKHRCRFLDSPVTGEQSRALDGTLTAIVGGDAHDLERARPVLNAMAKDIVHMGESGSGQLAKALNNCLYNISCAATGEILALATAAGLDPAAFATVVTGGTGQSFGFDKFAPLIQRDQFAAPQYGYPMGKAFKDMTVALATCEQQGTRHTDLRVLHATHQTYVEALDMGLGELNKGGMARVYATKVPGRRT